MAPPHATKCTKEADSKAFTSSPLARGIEEKSKRSPPPKRSLDAAAKALTVAKKRCDDNDDAGAIKMAEKALRLDPTCEEAVELRTWLVKCTLPPQLLHALGGPLCMPYTRPWR